MLSFNQAIYTRLEIGKGMQLEWPSLVEMDKNVLAQLEKHLTLNMAEEFGAGEIMHMSANRQRVSGAHLVAKLGIFVGHGM